MRMNEFKVFAHGPSFDVDAYLAGTKLEFDNVWRRGDQRRYSWVESEHDTSGVEIILGDGYSIPFSEQKQIAMEFLIRRRDELRALAEFDGVQTFILGLQYNVSLKSNAIGFTVSSSARLMWHALDVGLRPTYYVVSDRIGVER